MPNRERLILGRERENGSLLLAGGQIFPLLASLCCLDKKNSFNYDTFSDSVYLIYYFLGILEIQMMCKQKTELRKNISFFYKLETSSMQNI